MFELIIIRWIFWYMCRDKCNIKYDKIKNGEIKKKEKKKKLNVHPCRSTAPPIKQQTFHLLVRLFIGHRELFNTKNRKKSPSSSIIQPPSRRLVSLLRRLRSSIPRELSSSAMILHSSPPSHCFASSILSVVWLTPSWTCTSVLELHSVGLVLSASDRGSWALHAVSWNR